MQLHLLKARIHNGRHGQTYCSTLRGAVALACGGKGKTVLFIGLFIGLTTGGRNWQITARRARLCHKGHARPEGRISDRAKVHLLMRGIARAAAACTVHDERRFAFIAGIFVFVAGCSRSGLDDLLPDPGGGAPASGGEVASVPPDAGGNEVGSNGRVPQDAGGTLAKLATPEAGSHVSQPAGSVVLFGGFDDTGSFLGDTWTWNGSVWSQQVAPGPTPRVGSVMAPLGGQVVLFGGLNDVDPDAPYAGDTWVWNGSTWRQLDVVGPPGRAWAVMAPLDGRLILFGGTGNGLVPDSELADTWSWDGSVWTRLDMSGPSKRSGAAMAPLDGELVLFGGGDADESGDVALSDIWVWNGIAWSKAQGTVPSELAGAALAPAGRALLVFGGDPVGETWTWDAAGWTSLDVMGPPARVAAAIVTVEDRVLMFGGWGNVSVSGDDSLGDMWSWDGAAWTQIDVAGPPRRYAAAMANLGP